MTAEPNVEGSDPSWLRGHWMQTYTGVQFYPMHPHPDDVRPADVAHALGLLCRYNGHVDRFYSVAEHCVLVSRYLQAAGEDRETQLWGLLHDAAEAYVGDMVRPLKVNLPEFKVIEDRILACVGIRFGLQSSLHQLTAVKDADNRILMTERAELMSSTKHAWAAALEELEPLPVTVTGWEPREAEAQYLRRMAELTMLKDPAS